MVSMIISKSNISAWVGFNIVIYKYIIAWVPMVVIAIANGALRQLGNGPFGLIECSDSYVLYSALIFT
jgi:hypothetical protein